MKVFDLVAELLYDHNCVIVPGFGGFVANYKPAEFNPDSGIAKPRRKMVAFNQNLTENDGLLIQYVARKLQISYPQAEEKVKNMVGYIRSRLEQYRNFEFRSVGTIYLNKEDKLVFVPYENHNFYAQSYGLPGIKVRPVRSESKETAELVREVPLVEEYEEAETFAPDSMTSLRWRITGIAATLLLFIGAGYLGYQFSEEPGTDSSITLNQATDTEALGGILTSPTQKENNSTINPVPDESGVEDEGPSNGNETVAIRDADEEEATNSQQELDPAEEMPVPANKTTPVTKVDEEIVYHIIVAEPSSTEQAQRLMASNEIFKFFNTRILKQDAGNVLISIESFSNKKFADRYLKEIQTNNFTKAYILERTK